MVAGPLLSTLGALVSLGGDVTTNQWVAARSARALEESLGYGRGRLSDGWSVLVLKQTLTPADFRFSGLTLRSGGRLGLPAHDSLVDAARPRVSDQVMNERGPAEYAALQQKVLRDIPETGDRRIVKVIPNTRHSSALSPAEQYPMGGGGLQWTLAREARFLVAMTVDAFGLARIPGFAVRMTERMALDDRMKLARHINNA